MERTGTTSALALAGRQRVIALALAVVTVVLAVGAAVAVFRVGDSGAQAVWGGRVYQEQRFPAAPERRLRPFRGLRRCERERTCGTGAWSRA